jgi:hypothetical protein
MARQRITSIARQVKVAQAAGVEIAPPAHVPLADSDRPFWHSVIAEFPKADWSSHQLEVAAQLAKAMADLEAERTSLRTEGYVVEGKANPRHGIARDLTNSIMSLRRNLQLHARARDGEARDVTKRKAAGRQIEAAVSSADDDFIARPTIN